MGTLFKAGIGFAIAFVLLQGQGFPAISAGLLTVKQDIAASRPEARLAALLAPHSGTVARETQAHRLHP